MLRVIPLGGLGEIGLNAMAFDQGEDLFLVDAGLMFPPADFPSVDVIVPDFSYLRANQRRLRAVLLTHGHEDHIGALPYLLKDVNVPVYGTRFTLGLLQHRLEEQGVNADLREIHPREPFSVGAHFQVEPIRVAHSMPDAVGFALKTPEGTFVHTGDFKIDETPIDGHRTDLARLAQLGDEGVACLLSDSTNAEVEGNTPSEAVVAECFDRLFRAAPGRVIVSLFASHLLRVQHVLSLSAKLGRRVALLGRSLQRNVELGERLGTLQVPTGLLMSADETASLPPERVTLLSTGAQAEPRAALSQLLGEGRGLHIRRGDTVILSARAIPGNERQVTALIDALLERGAFVRYASIEPTIHVSGHASRAQQRQVLEAVRPQAFVPIHGELHHLTAHADLARMSGVRESGILLSRDGDVLGFERGQGRRVDQVPAGRIFTHRDTGAAVSFETLEERSLLNVTGVVAAALVVDRGARRIVSGPHLSSRGLTPQEEGALSRVAGDALRSLEDVSSQLRTDEAFMREELQRSVRRALKQHLGRKPTVVPIVVFL